MDFNQFHFAHPLWLLAAAGIPLVWAAFFLFHSIAPSHHKLERFIDSHLLPHLLINQPGKPSSFLKSLLLWSFVWGCLTLSLAGPRWDFREIETFSQDQSLVVILDLSKSMNAEDIRPSRLARAKHKIEDLINLAPRIKMGLIAFAADPHMITPLTEDKETIRHLLPSLDTELVYVQGSRLAPALEMAAAMMEMEPGNNKALLVISDGGFEDGSAITTAKKIGEKGIAIYTMGIGTSEGASLKDLKGSIIQKNGNPLLSKLEKEKLSAVSKAGNGHYLESHDEDTILKDLERRMEGEIASGKKNRLWEEHFYLLLLPVLPIFLWWFRRGTLFATMIIFSFSIVTLEAGITEEYFKNSEQLGKQALDEGNYKKALDVFQDPYRKGVAAYRAGSYAESEKFFRQSMREEVAPQAAYNVGNTLVKQEKLKEAIAAYEEVLEQWPDHTKAKENLELVKKELEQQQQSSSDENQNSKQDQNKSEPRKENKSEEKDTEKSENQDESEEKNQDEKQSEVNTQQKSEDNRNFEKENQPVEQTLEDEKGSEATPNENQKDKSSKTQEDRDADLWLDQIVNDPKKFMKNKFYIESKKNGTKEGIDPW
ncbi:MAG: VWA domain-containing protein [Candidatus Protochlamydia sp.]|nr:VWA domain-containing protein [Candidatus Protochlamydia sp.]